MMVCSLCGGVDIEGDYCRRCGARWAGGQWLPAAMPPGGAVGGVGPAPSGTSGWRPDPSMRHEGRWFVDGHATDLVRDGGLERRDPAGAAALGGPGGATAVGGPGGATAVGGPGGPRRRRRAGVLVAVLAAVAVIAVGGVGAAVWLTRDRTTVDDRYVAALTDEGLFAGFTSRPNAIAAGKALCRRLADGEPQQGLAADRVAVQYYCPDFLEGFTVLRKETIEGTFTLLDSEPNYYAPSIDVTGASCTGDGGYSDVRVGTEVVVKDAAGTVLTTTSLQGGDGDRYSCAFTFSFDLLEGEDQYLVEVGRRGSLTYSFDDLVGGRAQISLGD